MECARVLALFQNVFKPNALRKAQEPLRTSKAQMALTNAMLAEREAEASQRSQVAKQNAEAMIQKARALAQTQLLEAEQIVPQEIMKRKMQIEAEAEAQSKIIIARGEAEAILSIRQAEAEGIQKLLDAKATGYKLLFEACGEDAKSAATMLLIEKLEEIVKLQVEAIKNIKIDKITVWDSGCGMQMGKVRLLRTSSANLLNRCRLCMILLTWLVWSCLNILVKSLRMKLKAT